MRVTFRGLGAYGASAALLLGTIAAGASVASAAPVAPLFVHAIDDYSRYQGQETCVDKVQPGVGAFRAVVLPAYPGTGYGEDIRPCDQGGQSEHKDGRAWDWTIPDGHQGDAENLLTWLLAEDSYGNDNSILRRFGIMYIIWNRQIWRAYDADKGWQRYDGGDPHTSHVHFSFGWDGALEKTTWFTGQDKGLLLDQAGVGIAWRDPARVDLVRRADNGEVERRVWDGVWSTWESIGGEIDSAPAAGWTSASSFWVVASMNGQVVLRRWQDKNGWSDWETLDGDVTSGIGLVARNKRLDIFARSDSGSAIQITWSHGQWSDWTDLGGGITAPPAGAWSTRGVLQVFVRGNTGGIYQNVWQAKAWSGWTNLGGPYSSGPAAASLTDGQLDLFVRSATGSIVTRHLSDVWSDWLDLGGLHSSAPGADAVLNRRIDVFTTRVDGAAMQDTYFPDVGWRGWVKP